MWNRNEIAQWADVRNTSEEIAEAILEHVEWDEDKAQDIWANGCDAETEAAILSRAWSFADTTETDALYWGEATISRLISSASNAPVYVLVFRKPGDNLGRR